jgi:hypothetical protein
MGTSPAYLAGNALTSGTGAIPVRWNQVGNTGVVTYDVLRTTGSNATAPFGTGPFAVATAIPASSCANKVCTFLDDASVQPTTYSVSTDNNYWPALTLWPGNVILTTAWDYQNTGGGSSTLYSTDVLNTGSIVNSAGAYAPSVSAQVCNPQLTSSVWVQCGLEIGTSLVGGTVLEMSSAAGVKGRDIYEITPANAIGATEIVTWGDANPAKTMASPNNRASWDANDTYVAYDQPSAVPPSGFQLAFGAPISITNYTGSLPDNLHWGERLTPTLKSFQVPVQINNNLSVSGSLFANGPTAVSSGSGPAFAWQPNPPIKDSFSGSGSLGTNWTNTYGTWGESNNQAYSTANAGAGYASAVNTSSNFVPNQYAQAQVFNVASGSLVIGVGVRMSSTTLAGYLCYSDGPSAVGGTTVLAAVNGSGSGEAIGSGPGLPNGDYLMASAVGDQIACYDNGVPIITATDSSISSGYPGVFSADGVGYGKLANFSAGNFVYTLNGTVQPFTVTPGRYSRLAPCTSALEGTSAPVTDSAADGWGVTITGGGPYHVLGYCDGTAWTVFAR